MKVICPRCQKIVDKSKLKTQMNKIEFETSHLCQNCQDDFFGQDEFFFEKEEGKSL